MAHYKAIFLLLIIVNQLIGCRNCHAQGTGDVGKVKGILGVSLNKQIGLNETWKEKRFFSFESYESLFNSFTVVQDTVGESINIDYSGHQLFISTPTNEYLYLEAAFRHSLLQTGRPSDAPKTAGHVYVAYIHGSKPYLEKPLFYTQDIDSFIYSFTEEIKCVDNYLSPENRLKLIELFKQIP